MGRKHISKLGECKRFLFRETLTIHVEGVFDDWSPIAPYISARCETQARRVFFVVLLSVIASALESGNIWCIV